MNVLEAKLQEKYPELEIRSVDGFQGREKEVVILSLVRSNMKNNLGFIGEKRRLNVGVTRARRQLVLVCDSSTVCRDKVLGKFVSYMRDNGSVEEAPTLDTLVGSGRVISGQKRKASGSNKDEREAGSEMKMFKRIVFDEKFSAVKKLPNNESPGEGAQQKIPCKFEMRGKCSRGQTCTFSHSNELLDTARTSMHVSTPEDRRSSSVRRGRESREERRKSVNRGRSPIKLGGRSRSPRRRKRQARLEASGNSPTWAR